MALISHAARVPRHRRVSWARSVFAVGAVALAVSRRVLERRQQQQFIGDKCVLMRQATDS